MNRRLAFGIGATAVVTLAGTAAVVFAATAEPPPPRTAPTASIDTAERAVRDTARDFLREAQTGDPIYTCGMVIDNGAFSNNCANDLTDRADFAALAALDPNTDVTRATITGDTATVATTDLTPTPAVSADLGLVYSPTDGTWKVRELNHAPILWEGEPVVR